MSVEQIHINWEAMDLAEKALLSAANEQDKAVEDLRVEVKNSTAHWGGKAHTQFDQLFASWDALMNELRDQILKTSTGVKNAHAEFYAGEMRNAARFQM